jgi:hypothetical protein
MFLSPPLFQIDDEEAQNMQVQEKNMKLTSRVNCSWKWGGRHPISSRKRWPRRFQRDTLPSAYSAAFSPLLRRLHYHIGMHFSGLIGID